MVVLRACDLDWHFTISLQELARRVSEAGVMIENREEAGWNIPIATIQLFEFDS
jgi:hypothetical protein